jgi:4-hydroxythreonine-4-phosphate dehydrogenase
MQKKIKVGITMGDPSGVGPDIAVEALRRLKGTAEFIVIGDRWVFEKAAGRRFQAAGGSFIDVGGVDRRKFSWGKTRAEYGKASIAYLDCAMELLASNSLDCLVTCPISKESIHLAGYGYSGHTEYLAQRSQAKETAMMLLNKRLKVSLATRHVALKDVPSLLTPGVLEPVVRLSVTALKEWFGLKQPRIVVCGLNPHASDNGVIGSEENKVVKPFLKRLAKKAGRIAGPLSADIAIAKTVSGYYDCAIAMYHDQALIPLKLLDSQSGVNLTLGLPFVRTSPLHGTAFDIAGRRQADPSSLICAITLAVQCTSNRKKG